MKNLINNIHPGLYVATIYIILIAFWAINS